MKKKVTKRKLYKDEKVEARYRQKKNDKYWNKKLTDVVF